MNKKDKIISVEKIKKSFRTQFLFKKVEAIKNISFDVYKGEIFGFLGPNGAGKTTTIKLLNSLIKPSSGKISIFNKPPDNIEVRKKIGYLPEQPYFYDYLTPEELLDYFGLIFGINSQERAKRINDLLKLVGLTYAKKRILRKFSKGMLQRVGIASVLINNPELVILDEPLSGLDPIGRKQIMDIIVSLKNKASTVFFSSHILSDIERICDRVAIINKGVMTRYGALDQLLQKGIMQTEIGFRAEQPIEPTKIDFELLSFTKLGDYHTVVINNNNVNKFLNFILEKNVKIDHVTPKKETLEDLFVKQAIGSVEEGSNEKH